MSNQFATNAGTSKDDGSIWMNKNLWEERLDYEEVTGADGSRKMIVAQDPKEVGNKKTGYSTKHLSRYKPIIGKYLDGFEYKQEFEGNVKDMAAIKIQCANEKKLIVKSTAWRFKTQHNACCFELGDPIEVHRWGSGTETIWVIKKPGFESAEEYPEYLAKDAGKTQEDNPNAVPF